MASAAVLFRARPGVWPGVAVRALRPTLCNSTSRRYISGKAEDLAGSPREIKKIMIANRGEIAIRVMRAATEMGIRTVAIYSKEDSRSMHRQKADEAYMVGQGLAPVEAYLNIKEIVALAAANDVDAIHPGYGFLSERSDFARECTKAGIKFIGPSPDAIFKMGDKTEARKIAEAAGVQTVPGTPEAITNAASGLKFCQEAGFPVILKAAYGGGGRGMRIVNSESEYADAFERATSEALAAFGNGSVFIEKFIEKPRHIEVQVMGDEYGNVVHLYERDCSVQRRHQKVIELAPAMDLDPVVRESMLKDAVKLAQHAGYYNAGTVEYLLDKNGNYYFIEVNARLQVEHTVTEEVTGVDLVQTQIGVASGKSLSELGLSQDTIECRGNAIQARVTTEDPSQDFRPDTGRISHYRAGEGMGIRLDAGSGFSGSIITPFYDSLLVKVISRGKTHQEACRKLSRALSEFRIRGVKTNIPFIYNVLNHPDFVDGAVTTDFIGTHPDLTRPTDDQMSQNRAQRLLHFIGETTVNGPMMPLGVPDAVIGDVKVDVPIVPSTKRPEGLRDIFLQDGPEAFAKEVRNRRKNGQALMMDTTLRDAHQSLLATRMRTADMLTIAPYMAQTMGGAYALECWGGATYDVALRFLREDPWDRLIRLRERIPNVPFSMLLRGANAVGYTNYADNVVYKFCKEAKEHGMDVFRVFDSLNYYPNIQVGMDAVNQAGGIVEAAICYTGDVANPRKGSVYTLDYYLDFARKLVSGGAHVLCIKDMAGLLKPNGARLLVGALREEFPEIPIHVHTHDTAGAGVASMVACIQSGADAVDAAVDSMSGMTSQPSIGALNALLKAEGYDTGLDSEHLTNISNYFEGVRRLYAPFECTQSMKSGSSDVYEHEIPGGQYTNLQFQAFSLGLLHEWNQIKKAYAVANIALGDLVKVTPSSKIVGDLAQFMVQNKIETVEQLNDRAASLNFPNSVIEFFQGLIGQPPNGFPQALAETVVGSRTVYSGRPGADLPPVDFDAIKKKIKEDHFANYYNKTIWETDALNYALYPAVTDEYIAFRKEYGDVSKVDTATFFKGMTRHQEIEIEIQKGKTLHITLKAIGDVDARGQRELYFEVNGQPRSIHIMDKTAGAHLGNREQADKGNKGSIGAPMPGSVLSVKVKVGDKLGKGDPLAILSAMKMETVVTAPFKGSITKVSVEQGDELQANDLICEMVDA
eukprot:Clim_evm53s149 gene=Clim_evmTU53s149